ncbi:hypothetical protein [Providencia phage PSTCR6]|nr:hypothetical protein [Providencia phage PSTCR6]
MSDIILNELFDSDEVNNYQAINVNPKTKVPQLWNIKVPGNENLLVRMVSYLSKGDALKQVKQGDKFVQVFLMSLSEKGNIAELRGGLGKDPIGALDTIFDTVYEQVKKLKMDAVLFRFPAKKMKGQEKTLQRIIKRLAMQRTGGKFVVLEDLYQFTGKHAYVLIYRKNRPLEDIAGIPGIDSSLYTKVDSKVGDVYINDKTGKQVSKMEAIAGSIAAQENERNERSLISKTKVSRRELMAALYSISKPDDLKNYSELGREAFVKLHDNPPIYDSSETSVSTINQNVSFRVEENKKAFIEKIHNDSVHLNKNTEGLKRYFMIFGPWLNDITEFKPVDDSIRIKELKPMLKGLNDSVASSKNSFDAFKKFAQYLELYGPKNENLKLKTLKNVIEYLNAEVFLDPVSGAFMSIPDSDFSNDEKEAIETYSNRAYEEINDFLLGKDPSVKKVFSDYIPNLDNAFSKGTKLAKGTILYRAQRLDYRDLDKAIKSKVLYFPNYVSTSLAPIIFGQRGNAYKSLDPKSASVLFDESWDDVAKTIIHPDVLEKPAEELKPSQTNVRMGIVIKGAENLKVLIPGNLSKFSSECEVILPRGVGLKINKISGVRNEATVLDSNQNYLLVETSVIPPEQLSENAELYDGDLFMNEGKLEKLSGFSKFLHEAKLESKLDNIALDLLAEVMDLSSIPEKFIK